MTKYSAGLTIAAAVGTLLAATGCGSDDGDEDTRTAQEAVRCEGINECKGTSECAGAHGDNECQGLNECAGQGWITVDSEEACTDEGGKVLS